MLVHSDAGHADHCLVDNLHAYLQQKGDYHPEQEQSFAPAICNRLDRNTSGILVAGKTLNGLQQMSKAFRERSMEKYYLAIVAGHISKPRRIEGFLKKDEKNNQVTILSEPSNDAKPIITEYRPLKLVGQVTLLEVHLITGRSHQIRAHLASIGHPVIGDTKYGNPRLNREFLKNAGVTHQLLHAYRLFLADGTKIQADAPKEFERALECQRTGREK